jgi:adenylate cyclase class 2
MAVEIEIKMKVDDLAPVREKLKHLGARRMHEVLETNIFFDTREHDLLASDCGLRLRRARDLETAQEKLVITYKGPRAEGFVKRREEIEVIVDKLDPAVTLLERLGYVRQLSFEKRRENWKLERCSVELDTLPKLGSFVEIECANEAEILSVRKKLGLEHLEPISSTYADLVSQLFSDQHTRESTLKFT